MISLTLLNILKFVLIQILWVIGRPVKLMKPIIKVGVPALMLAAGSYQNADAQSIRGPPVRSGRGDFIVLGEDERPMPLSVDKTPYNSYVDDIMQYTVDILKVKHVKTGKNFVILYPNDRVWSKGDTIDVNYLTRPDMSTKWTDYEIVNRTVDIPTARAANPKNVDFYDAVIYKLNDVRPNFDFDENVGKEN